jgi:hypothetical protein
MQAIAMAAQSYRKTYGDFPNCSTSTGDNPRRELLDQLIGRRVVRFSANGAPLPLVEYNDTSLPGGTGGRDNGNPSFKGRKQRSFLSSGNVTTNDDSSMSDLTNWDLCREFIDAWGNPYEYRYRVIGSHKAWLSPNFLLVSCSSNFIPAASEGAPLDDGEYWDPAPAGGSTMTRSGIVPPTYFDESGDVGPFRADNIVNWAN